MVDTNEQKTKFLNFVELLNEPQPYEELKRLQDQELSLIDSKDKMISKIQGSLIGLAVGDALGAHVEFRPHSFLKQNPVKDMQGGGTWGLEEGQWTDDTSMALCLAASLIVKNGFNGYDQLVRYKRWFRNGYMSSTGDCFDIGAGTCQAIKEFEQRQRHAGALLRTKLNRNISNDDLDKIIEENYVLSKIRDDCGAKDGAGNGSLMRLAPIPLFYFRSEIDAIKYAGRSATLTHGDKKAIDACQFYSSLIWNAINDVPKDELLDPNFFSNHFQKPLDDDVMKVVQGSYKNKPNGYDDGIRGRGFIIYALEAALWAFANDENSFEKGVLLVINLGDDTDTTAAIYGQLAGAVYGIESIPEKWRQKLFQHDFLILMANALYLKGQRFDRPKRKSHDVDDIEESEPSTKNKSNSDSKRKPVTILEED